MWLWVLTKQQKNHLKMHSIVCICMCTCEREGWDREVEVCVLGGSICKHILRCQILVTKYVQRRRVNWPLEAIATGSLCNVCLAFWTSLNIIRALNVFWLAAISPERNKMSLMLALILIFAGARGSSLSLFSRNSLLGYDFEQRYLVPPCGRSESYS